MEAAAQTLSGALSDTATPRDVLEPFNRLMFGFNTLVVDYIVDPAARVLGDVTPAFVQRISSNIYENISEPAFVFTNLLAGHTRDASVSVGRFAVNSTIGIGGIFDVATPIGLERRTTEFSEATCKLGVPPGPYLILPLIGPTNVFSGGLLGVTLAVEWYVLSPVSAALAVGNAIVGVGVAAASLRHVRDIPQDPHPDHYALQQEAFWDYVKAGCAPGEGRTMLSATGVSE